MRYRALDGRPTRAAPWGYDSFGQGRNKEWRINPGVANTIILVGETFVETGGFRRTAARLNERGVPTAGRLLEGGVRGGGKWTPKSVAHVLRVPYYRGQLVHGATKAVRQAGSVVKVRAGDEEVLRVACPHLRIWPDALLSRIDELLGRVKRASPYRAASAGHLASSFLQCSGWTCSCRCSAWVDLLRGRCF